MSEKLLTIRQLAEVLNVTEQHLYRTLREPDCSIPVIMVGKVKRFLLSDILKETKNKSVTESIFSGKSVIIPMADVQHIEKHWYSSDNKETEPHRGIQIITKHTKWNHKTDCWENQIYIQNNQDGEAAEFMKHWCLYRYELESITIKDMRPSDKK